MDATQGHAAALACLSLVASVAINFFNAGVFGRDSPLRHTPVFASALYTLAESVLAVGILSGTYGFRRSLRILRALYARPTPGQWLLRFAPCALATAVSVALSHASLRFISLALYVIIKSSAPLFLLLFTAVLGLERPGVRMAVIAGVLLLGLVLSTQALGSDADASVRADPRGIILVIVAAMASGLRWALVQLIVGHIPSCDPDEHAGNVELLPTTLRRPSLELDRMDSVVYLDATVYSAVPGNVENVAASLSRPPSQASTVGLLLDTPSSETSSPAPGTKRSALSVLHTPLCTVVMLAPMVAVVQLVLALAFELRMLVLDSPLLGGARIEETVSAYMLCVFGGTLAFVLALIDYAVVHATSALFFSLLGLVKEVVLVVLSVVLLGDTLSLPQMAGALVSIAGLTYYALSRDAPTRRPPADDQGASACSGASERAVPLDCVHSSTLDAA